MTRRQKRRKRQDLIEGTAFWAMFCGSIFLGIAILGSALVIALVEIFGG